MQTKIKALASVEPKQKNCFKHAIVPPNDYRLVSITSEWKRLNREAERMPGYGSIAHLMKPQGFESDEHLRT